MMEHRSLTFSIFIHVSALLLGIFILAPIVWLLIMSISDTNDLTTIPLRWLPQTLDLHRYHEIISLAANSVGSAFLTALRNSLAVAILASLGALAVAIPAAWSVSRANGRLNFSLYVVVGTYMLPPVALVVPIYFALSAMGALNSVFSLAIVYLSILAPFTTWLLKSNFDHVPAEIEQAAMIDGARLDQILRRITLPLAAPALTTAGLFAFLLAWDEFFYALLFTAKDSKTLPVFIADLAGGRVADYGLIATAGVMASLPPVLIGFFLQKSLVSGLTAGSVKG
jgi:multiple sugar transport system permease protein